MNLGDDSTMWQIYSITWPAPPQDNTFLRLCMLLLGFDDKVVGVIPVGQQVSGLLVVHSDIVVRKQPWEEVVDLSGDVQNEADSVKKHSNRWVFVPLLTQKDTQPDFGLLGQIVETWLPVKHLLVLLLLTTLMWITGMQLCLILWVIIILRGIWTSTM